MSFIDKLTDVAGKVGDTIGKGAKSAKDGIKSGTDKFNIKKEINQTESDLNKVYIEIGKKFCELNSDDPSSEYAEMVSLVKEKKAKIDTLKNELAAIDDKAGICSNCGAALERDSKFCAKCGTPVNTPKPVVQASPNVTKEAAAEAPETAENVEVSVETPAEKVCPKCGTASDPESKFCEKCGSSLAD